MVLAPAEDDGRGILSTHLHTDGTLADILCIPGGGSSEPAHRGDVESSCHKVT